jgi:hypothetical protein
MGYRASITRGNCNKPHGLSNLRFAMTIPNPQHRINTSSLLTSDCLNPWTNCQPGSLNHQNQTLLTLITNKLRDHNELAHEMRPKTCYLCGGS